MKGNLKKERCMGKGKFFDRNNYIRYEGHFVNNAVEGDNEKSIFED